MIGTIDKHGREVPPAMMTQVETCGCELWWQTHNYGYGFVGFVWIAGVACHPINNGGHITHPRPEWNHHPMPWLPK